MGSYFLIMHDTDTELDTELNTHTKMMRRTEPKYSSTIDDPRVGFEPPSSRSRVIAERS